MDKEFRFTGFVRTGDELAPISLVISEPVVTDEDAYCEIHAPGLLARDTKIFGVDAEQAQELAIGFIKRTLNDRQLVDTDGHLVELS